LNCSGIQEILHSDPANMTVARGKETEGRRTCWAGQQTLPSGLLSEMRTDGAKRLLSDDFASGKRFGGAIASHIGSFLSRIKRPGGTAC
jgi:hypothetical protein